MSDPSAKNTATLVKGLGGVSLGLGISEILAPGKVAAAAGIDDTSRSRSVIRALGLRECAHAAALLFGPPKLVWTRVVGDILDVTLFGVALAKSGNSRRRRGAASAVALAAIGAADLYAALRTTRHDGRHANAAPHRSLRAAVTVRRTPEDVYRFWRDLENLPSFMYHLQSVTDSGDHSHWVANAPIGQSAEWDAQITDDVPNQRIAWQSMPKASVEHSGSVEFSPAPDDNGTEVRVTIGYRLPGGLLGKAVATAFGESPEQQVSDDLRRFKQILETGQVMRSDGSPQGTAAYRQMHQQPAQASAGSKK
ncbi:MAG: SRPBCC family protein [Mycobacterium sp.]|nr:SRPBCC family protein [Mycobacterium sp.]